MCKLLSKESGPGMSEAWRPEQLEWRMEREREGDGARGMRPLQPSCRQPCNHHLHLTHSVTSGGTTCLGHKAGKQRQLIKYSLVLMPEPLITVLQNNFTVKYR